MTEVLALDIFLYDKQIGTITHLPGDRNVFTFSQDYIDDLNRPTLSLSFKDTLGNLITRVKSTRTRLPPFFANLLPEGYLRDYLASQAKVSAEREFYLLRALGNDLPGALSIHPSNEAKAILDLEEEAQDIYTGDRMFRFSLAGVQLKFSATWEKNNRLTIPVDGVGGSWIVKLPSATYPNVPENEYAMMELARRVGINVPETAFVSLNEIEGVPDGFQQVGSNAYAIKRFDRETRNRKIHIEDFAQIFGVYPEKKYDVASYRNIAEIISAETGEDGLIEFIRRFVFNALIGNGDMHLKNWSLIYPDKKTAVLAPAYDFVSTIPYIPADSLALNFVDSKAFTSLTLDQFKRFASKASLSEALVLDVVQETVNRFKNEWDSVRDFPLNNAVLKTIEEHFKKVPIFES